MKILISKKATTITKILPKTGKINFSIAFQLKFNQKKQPPKPRYSQKTNTFIEKQH